MFIKRERQASSGAPSVPELLESIRVQTEQKGTLSRVFNELEKELRNLTDSRLALESQLDYLNLASNATSATNVASTVSNSAVSGPSIPKTTSGNISIIQATPITTLPQSTSNPTNLSGKVLILDSSSQQTPLIATSSAASGIVNSANMTTPAFNPTSLASSQITSKSAI